MQQLASHFAAKPEAKRTGGRFPVDGRREGSALRSSDSRWLGGTRPLPSRQDARSRLGSAMPMSAALAFVAVFGCVPYEYADPEVARNASMRFGAPYELHATPPPRLSLRCDCGKQVAW